MNIYSILFVGLIAFQPALAAPVSSEILAKGSQSWDGAPIEYRQGPAELTVQRIRVSAGGEAVALPIHCHTIPLAAYVTQGSVRVVKTSGEERIFKSGDAFIEVMNQWHKGIFVEDTELIVVYAGAKDVPISFKQDEGSPLAASCN